MDTFSATAEKLLDIINQSGLVCKVQGVSLDTNKEVLFFGQYQLIQVNSYRNAETPVVLCFQPIGAYYQKAVSHVLWDRYHLTTVDWQQGGLLLITLYYSSRCLHISLWLHIVHSASATDSQMSMQMLQLFIIQVSFTSLFSQTRIHYLAYYLDRIKLIEYLVQPH